MSETVIVVESITPQVSLTFSNDQGPQGAGGNTGPAGNSATIAIGAVATGAPGSAATVTNVGTSSAATLNFSIPQGDPGSLGTATPLALGTAAVGTAAAASHEDHVHPTTGVVTTSSLGTGVATFLSTPTSANLLSALTTETGTGNVVFGTGPTISAPIIDNPRIGYSTTVTGSGGFATVLTSASNYQQFFTGSTTGHNVSLPNVLTLTLGTSYYINNNSTVPITINTYNLGATILVMPANTTAVFTCINVAINGSTSWDADYTGATSITGTGSLVLGTAPTITLANGTGLPISTGVSGLGTGIATALAVNTGTAGAPVINGGALGTPSGGTLTNATGLPIAGLVSSTTTALGVGSIELGHATDTTIARVSAGVASIEGNNILTVASTTSALTSFGASPTFTGTVTIPTVAAGTTSTATVGAGYMGLPQNGTTTGAATVAASDAGKHIYSTATRTITIDSNANLALPIGTTVTFIAGSGATVTIAITTDTMYLAGVGTTGSRTLAAFGMATAVKIAATTWIISGNGLS